MPTAVLEQVPGLIARLPGPLWGYSKPILLKGVQKKNPATEELRKDLSLGFFVCFFALVLFALFGCGLYFSLLFV